MKTKSKMIPMMALSLVAVLTLCQDSKNWNSNFRSIANVETNEEVKKKPDESSPEKKPDERKKDNDSTAKIDYDDIYECQNRQIKSLRKEVAQKMKDLEKILRDKRKTQEDEYLDGVEDNFAGLSKRDLLKEVIMGRMSGFNMPQFSIQPSFAIPQQMFQLPSYQGASFAEQSIQSDFNYQTELLKLQYVQQRRTMELNLNNSIGINNEFGPYSRYNRNWSIDASNLYSSSPSVYNHPYQALENQFRPMPINDGQFYLANSLSSRSIYEQKGFTF